MQKFPKALAPIGQITDNLFFSFLCVSVSSHWPGKNNN